MKISEKTIPAGEFKAKCLAILDEVSKTGRPLVITRRGKPLVTLNPIHAPPSLIGSVEFVGDIIAPIDVKWDAER